MLGRLFKPKDKSTSEEIQKQRAEWLQQMLDKSNALERMIKSESSGWKEFCALIEDYIDKAKKRKALTALDRATDADLYELKLLDHEIFILMWLKRIPEQFISGVEAEIKKENAKES